MAKRKDTTVPPIAADFKDTLRALLNTPPPPKNLGRPKAKKKTAKEALMWQPSRAQWVAIWTTFAVALLCWVWPNEGRWLLQGFGSYRMTRGTYQTLRIFLVIGGGLTVWWLESRRA